MLSEGHVHFSFLFLASDVFRHVTGCFSFPSFGFF